MAKKVWLGGDGAGGEQTDFDRIPNWLPAGIPVDGDNLIFDDRANTDTATGKKYSCLSGLNNNSKNFTRILVDSSYDGDIGIGYGSPNIDTAALACGCDEIIFRGSGNAWLTAWHASALFDSVVCDSSSGALYIGKAAANGQQTTSLLNIQGQVQFLGPITSFLFPPDLHALKQLLSGATTIITGGGCDSIDLIVLNGQLFIDSGFATLMMVAGTMNWGNDGFVPSAIKLGGVGEDSVKIYGGVLNWKMLSTLQALKLWGGQVVASGAQAKTLGLSTINSGTIELWNGSLDLQTSQSGDMVLGANCEVNLKTRVASFLPPKNQDITW